jgi:hypothetical protein
MAKAKEKKYVTVYTPIGIISYPYLHKPDTGRKNSSNKYSAEIYVPKAEMASEQGKAMIAGVLEVAREYFGKPKMKLADCKGPFTDMDTVPNCEDWQKGHIRIRAKAAYDEVRGVDNKPVVIGPRKDPNTLKFPVLTEEQVKAIKGGDHVRLICGVYGYEQQGGGIALGLNFVQFAKEGKALGQGKLKAIESLGEIEVEVESAEELVDVAEADETDDLMKFG